MKIVVTASVSHVRRGQAPSFLPHCFFLLFSFLFLAQAAGASAANQPRIFNTLEEPQQTMDYLTQWVKALERHLTQDAPEGECTDGTFNKCHLREWYAFLATIKDNPRSQQIDAVNRYANQKAYVIDPDNYSLDDYWAIPREFLYNGGDCEDYAITKFFSLRWLGYGKDDLRLLILQDTNLRIRHAVLLVFDHEQVLVLDNQSQQVVPQEKIVHYVPLYSLNEQQWWLHVPPVRQLRRNTNVTQ